METRNGQAFVLLFSVVIHLATSSRRPKGIMVARGPAVKSASRCGALLLQVEHGKDIDAFTSRDPIVKNGVGYDEHFKMLHLATRN